MPKPLSLDLRSRIVAFVVDGHSRRSAAAKFEVSASSAVRFASLAARSGDVMAKPMGGRRRSRLDAHRDFLSQRIADKPDLTLFELRDEFGLRGIKIDASTLSRWLIKNGYTYKKNTAGQRTGASGRRKGAPGMDANTSTFDES